MTRPATDHREVAALLAATSAALLALAGCSPLAGSECQPTCQTPLHCHSPSGTCQPDALSDYTDQTPGRRLRTTLVDGRPFIAAIAPAENLVLAGPPDEPSALARLENADRSAVALASHAGHVTVGWLTDERRYRLAELTDGRWEIGDPVAIDGQNYAGSRHFDLAVEPNGVAHLLYRDTTTNALHHLRRTTAGDWQRNLVDDGTAVESRQDCASRSAETDYPGVGYDPDVTFGSDRLLAAYYDGGCGDLRLARSSGDGWGVSVVDNGDYTVPGDPIRKSGDVGRFASIAVDPRGDVAIAYHDLRRGQLMFARESTDQYEVDLVDPGRQLDALSRKRKQLVGAFADLAFDASGTPYIAYMNTSENRLRLAYRARTSGGSFRWLHRALDAEPPAGFFASVEATDTRGIVVLAEQMKPTADGVDSRLVTLADEAR